MRFAGKYGMCDCAGNTRTRNGRTWPFFLLKRIGRLRAATSPSTVCFDFRFNSADALTQTHPHTRGVNSNSRRAAKKPRGWQINGGLCKYLDDHT